MPQSLVNEFIDRRKAGEPFGSSLKEAIFQAKSTEYYDDDDEEPKFELFKLNMRGLFDEEPVDWWFASTAIPLIAATFGPLANVMSIGALVTSWRVDLIDPTNPTGPLLPELQGQLIRDPRWCYSVNLISLIFGFLGNLFLLLNFGNRIKYVIALPMSIILWFLSAGLLIGDLAAMNGHAKPDFSNEIWSGGFWYGLAAACLYLGLTICLLANLIGYVRGHYPQHFELTEDQRTLIIQTMFYYLWLAGAAGVYSNVESWHFIDALYFACVTVLTVGYGDLYPQTNLGRALLIPFSFGGILILGLVVFSIYKSITELGQKNVIRHHYEKSRERTLGRTVTTSLELERKEIEMELARERAHAKHAHRSSARSPATIQTRPTTFQLLNQSTLNRRSSVTSTRPPSIMSTSSALSRTNSIKEGFKKKKRIRLLREEKERFEAMRKIQSKSEEWKRWVRLVISLTIFAVFWFVGAVGFWQTEKETLGLTYWEAVYFTWVTLITLGYGDISPHSWGGRCLYVIWVQFAVPAITILAQDMTSTVVATFNSLSHNVTTALLPRTETLHLMAIRWPWVLRYLPGWVQHRIQDREAQMRVDMGFPVGPTSNDISRTTKEDAFASGEATPDLAALASQHEADVAGKVPDAAALARQLALAIKRAAIDMAGASPKQYSYEEWVEFTRLIRFSAIEGVPQALKEEESEGLVEWDWLSDKSPMMAETTEPEFVLERLCESLVRYLRRNPPNSDFSNSLKEQGEQALRLRTIVTHDDEDLEAQLSPSSSSERRPSLISKLIGGNRDLHPVEEEDHHNEIQPVGNRP